MNMFARFNENPAMTLQDIKETKRYGRTDRRTHGRTDARTDNVKTVYPLQTKFAGGINIFSSYRYYIQTNWIIIARVILHVFLLSAGPTYFILGLIWVQTICKGLRLSTDNTNKVKNYLELLNTQSENYWHADGLPGNRSPQHYLSRNQ